MSILETRKIEPLSGTSVTLGAAGDTVTVPTGGIVKSNTVKDAGGNTLWASDGAGNLSSINSAFHGSTTFISSATMSATSTVEFSSGITSTYDEYMFVCTDIHPASNSEGFVVNFSTGGAYTIAMTTTAWQCGQYENGTREFQYEANRDLSQGTNQRLAQAISNDADATCAGILYLYGPSSTTYAKNFYSRFHNYHDSNISQDWYIAGYVNTTSAVTGVQFKMSSGNIDVGTIAMYGIK